MDQKNDISKTAKMRSKNLVTLNSFRILRPKIQYRRELLDVANALLATVGNF